MSANIILIASDITASGTQLQSIATTACYPAIIFKIEQENGYRVCRGLNTCPKLLKATERLTFKCKALIGLKVTVTLFS